MSENILKENGEVRHHHTLTIASSKRVNSVYYEQSVEEAETVGDQDTVGKEKKRRLLQVNIFYVFSINIYF